MIAKKKNRGPRGSVSAGSYKQETDFKAPFIQKSTEDEKAIRDKLNMAFMFSALDEKEKDQVIGACAQRKAVAKEAVITEGEEGDCLYIVGSGTLACTKIFAGNTEPTSLKTYQPGEAFGELALLYNAPRAATITANEDCILWKLDRDTFNYIVKDASRKKRQKYEELLEKVELLSTMETYERQALADAFSEHTFKKGDYIITEGEDGKDLFFLQEGEAAAMKN